MPVAGEFFLIPFGSLVQPPLAATQIAPATPTPHPVTRLPTIKLLHLALSSLFPRSLISPNLLQYSCAAFFDCLDSGLEVPAGVFAEHCFDALGGVWHVG